MEFVKNRAHSGLRRGVDDRLLAVALEPNHPLSGDPAFFLRGTLLKVTDEYGRDRPQPLPDCRGANPYMNPQPNPKPNPDPDPEPQPGWCGCLGGDPPDHQPHPVLRLGLDALV